MRHLLVLSTIPTLLIGLFGCSPQDAEGTPVKVVTAEVVFEEVDFADGRQQIVLSMGVQQGPEDAISCSAMTFSVDLGWLGDEGAAELEIPGEGLRTIYDVALEDGESIQVIGLELVDDASTLCRAEATVWLSADADLSGALVGEPRVSVAGKVAGLEVAGGLQAIAEAQ